MKRNDAQPLALAAAIALAISLSGCGGGAPTSPAPAATPSFAGSYTLTVDASSVCRLPVSHYEWTVQATTADIGAGAKSASVTLPNGDPKLDLLFHYGVDPDPTRLGGNFETITHGQPPGLAIPGGLIFSTNSVVFGAVSAAAARAQILAGQLQGAIVVMRPDQEFGDPAPTCSAADHRWSLVPR